MNTSESIKNIATALAKAQGEMTGAVKDQDNPFFKSSYADLAAVIRAISAPFANHGLSFSQSPGFEEGRIVVTTRIMHTSGEWIEGETVLPPTKNDAQGYGSAITYAKRYGLQAMAGVPSVDDDGNAAVEQKTETQPKKTRKTKAILQKFESAESIEELAAIWKSLNKDQHALYEDDKNQAKERLAA